MQRRLLLLLPRLQTQLEQIDGLLREQFEGAFLLHAELTWLAVNHAQGAQVMAFTVSERHAGIEANIRSAGHQRIVPEAWIQ